MSNQNLSGTGADEASGSRILLAAARPESAEHYRKILELRDHSVLIVADAKSALKATMQKSFDLLLCVIQPNDAEARQILDVLRHRPHLANLPGISISSSSSLEDMARSESAGFAVHVTEPVDPQRLLRMVQLILRGEDPIHSFTRKESDMPEQVRKNRLLPP
jgi:CheY-like chemotaxis protein